MSYKTWNFREHSVNSQTTVLSRTEEVLLSATPTFSLRKKQPQASGPYNQFHLYIYYILAFRVAWPQTNKKVIPSKHFHIHVVG